MSDADLILLGKSDWSKRNQIGSTVRVVVINSPSNPFSSDLVCRVAHQCWFFMIDHLIPCKVLSVALLIHSGGHPVNIPVLAQNESIAKKQQSDVNFQSRISGSPLELQWILDLDLTMLANLTTSFRCLNLSLLAKSDYDYIERKNFIELHKKYTDRGIFIVS